MHDIYELQSILHPDYPLCYYISGPDSPACDRSVPVVGEVTTQGWRSVDSCFKLTSDPSVAVMVTFGLLCNTRDLYNLGRSAQQFKEALRIILFNHLYVTCKLLIIELIN